MSELVSLVWLTWLLCVGEMLCVYRMSASWLDVGGVFCEAGVDQ